MSVIDSISPLSPPIFSQLQRQSFLINSQGTFHGTEIVENCQTLEKEGRESCQDQEPLRSRDTLHEADKTVYQAVTIYNALLPWHLVKVIDWFETDNDKY